jgi:hypothetical protein
VTTPMNAILTTTSSSNNAITDSNDYIVDSGKTQLPVHATTTKKQLKSNSNKHRNDPFCLAFTNII